MKLSVIIACFNGRDTIGAQLEALADQRWSGPWEVIVADNGSTDDSRGVIERYRQRLPNLRIVDASARRGKSFALNLAIQSATGDALLFCDADDEMAPGWISAMAEALTQHDFVASRIDTDKLNSADIQKRRGNPQSQGLQKLRFPPYVPIAGGGTFGVMRRLHEAVGGFDEDLHAHEDTFYCIKMHRLGTRLHFVPNAVMHVRFRGSFRDTYRQARSYGYYYALVYKKCLALGMPKEPTRWSDGISGWQWVLRQAAQLRRKEHVINSPFAWSLGYRIGRLKGSIAHHVVLI
jgi:glycosyltransferase involved in cell wall biosynthesis